MKSAGVMIGWNENLHTLGPPWQRLDIPGLNGFKSDLNPAAARYAGEMDGLL